MKLALTAAIATSVTVTAAAQDMLVCVEDSDGDGRWTVTAEYLSEPPSDIVAVWGDIGLRITGNDAITLGISDFNTAYTQLLFAIDGNGTTEVSFSTGTNAFFGSPDPSNPLFVFEFIYHGAVNALRFELEGFNSAIFDSPPFGDVRLYQDQFGNPGELSMGFKYIPVPATLVLSPVVLMVMRRTRKEM
ncbi:MAG: hypothetical protein AAFS11_01295 [Planctomycetota bacterium]